MHIVLSKRAQSLLLAGLAFVLVGLPSAAKAESITYLSPQVALAINDLSIGGVAYDVTFAQNTVDPTFLGDRAGASQAAQAIENALNAGTAAYVHVPGLGSINQFSIFYDGNGGGITLYNNWAVGAWEQAQGTYESVTASFSPLAPSQVTPEPASILLCGTGAILLGLLALAERRRLRASA